MNLRSLWLGLLLLLSAYCAPSFAACPHHAQAELATQVEPSTAVQPLLMAIHQPIPSEHDCAGTCCEAGRCGCSVSTSHAVIAATLELHFFAPTHAPLCSLTSRVLSQRDSPPLRPPART